MGHAQIAVKKAFDRILGRPSEPADAGKKIVDPISIGVAGKSLFALAKLFAALWVPVVVQIVQMASSRNNEGMADEDGALLGHEQRQQIVVHRDMRVHIDQTRDERPPHRLDDPRPMSGPAVRQIVRTSGR